MQLTVKALIDVRGKVTKNRCWYRRKRREKVDADADLHTSRRYGDVSEKK